MDRITARWPLLIMLLGVIVMLGLQLYPVDHHYVIAKGIPPHYTPGDPKGMTADNGDRIIDTGKLNLTVQTMQIVLSVVLLLAGLWVILSKQFAPGDKHWWYGMMGTILGFWLKR
jgi:hypothetical protein